MPALRRPLLLMAFLSLVALGCGEEKAPDPSPNTDGGIVLEDGGTQNDGGSKPDGSVVTNLEVASVSPQSGATGVARNTSITVTFSAAIDQDSVGADTLLVFPADASESAKVAGSFSFPASGATVVFKPQSALSAGKQYTVLIKGGASGILGEDGSALAADVQGNFTTSNSTDTTKPTVSSTDPADGDTEVPLDTTITIRFSEEIDPASLNDSSFEFIETWYGAPQDSPPVTGTWDTSNNPTVVFTPDALLGVGDEYTITLKAGGVTDLAGNALASDYSFSFDAAWNSPDQVPTVTATSPADEATGVPTNTALQITFSKEMRQATVTSPTTVKLFPSNNDTAVVTMQRNYYGNPVFLFYPQSNLAPNTRYTLKIEGGADGVKDASDIAMKASYSIHFTTGDGPDTSALEITSITPADGATDVSQSTTVSVTFNKLVDPAKLFLSYPGTTGTFLVSDHNQYLFPKEGTLDFSQNPTVTFTLAASQTLDLERTYYVKVTGGAQGVRSLTGATMAADFTSTFTTKGPDTADGTIEDLRAVTGDCAIRVRGVYMTFFRDVPNNWHGFFIQKDRAGPAIFVVTGNSLPAYPIYPTGNGYPKVDITVTRVEDYEGFKEVVAYTMTRSTDDPNEVDLPFIKDNIVQVIGDVAITEDYDSELVQIDGTLSNYRPGTTENRLYDLNYGTNKKVTLKVADGIKVPLALQNGSRVRVLAPIQQDNNGYFIKPYGYSTEDAMTATDLDDPANYDYLLDIVKLAP